MSGFGFVWPLGCFADGWVCVVWFGTCALGCFFCLLVLVWLSGLIVML